MKACQVVAMDRLLKWVHGLVKPITCNNHYTVCELGPFYCCRVHFTEAVIVEPAHINPSLVLSIAAFVVSLHNHLATQSMENLWAT